MNAVAGIATTDLLKRRFLQADDPLAMPKRILIAAADAALVVELARLVRTLDIEPVARTRAAAAIAALGAGPFDLCLVDLALPADEGIAVIMKAQAARRPVATVALAPQGAGAVEALCAGAAEIVARRFCPVRLAALMRRLSDGTAAPRAGVPIVGDHPRVRQALERVAEIAATDAPVLLCGETGTGKESFARLLHAASARAAGPFVAVNLAGLPESAAEAELFGQDGGPANDNEVGRAGWWAAASGGTLFIEEVDGLPARTQARLLEHGDDGPRIVVASRLAPDEIAGAGRLLPALQARLQAGTIELPPLRERREDIPALAEGFRRQVNAREGRKVPGFALDVMRRLSQHDWPGNVRELENLVERLVVMAGTRMVVMKDLPAHLRIQVIDFERATRRLPIGGVDLRELLAELEGAIIAEALARTAGNRNRAAELLGLNRTTLVEKLRRRSVA
jgi:DNA-binding NtrC family response regulator